MTIERRDVSSRISAGNFGRPGTPLGHSRPRKGPDYGRLLNSLGVVAQEFAREEQADQEAAAGAAIREVLIETKNSSREERAAAINKVREQFSDQGTFVSLFAKENPAVKTIDKINGRAQALTTRGTINQIMQDTAGEPLEVRQEKLLAAVQESAAFTQGISDESHQNYMKNITEFALQADDNLVSQESIRIKTENQNKVYNNYILEAEEMFNFYSGVDAETMSNDPEAFQAGQASLDTDEAQSDMKEIIEKTGRELYQDTLAVGGTKEEASQRLANYVHHMAKKYNRPEIITNAMGIPLSNGLKLKDVHGAALDKAEESVTQSLVRKQASFRQQAEMQRNKEFQAQYHTTRANNEVMIQRAKDNPENTELTQEALTSVRQQREELIATQSNYEDNPDHFSRMLGILNHNVADLEDSLGDPMVEETAMDMITKGTMNSEWYITNANKLDNVYKKRVQAYLGEERSAATANAAQQAKNVKLLASHDIQEPMSVAIDNYNARINNSITKLQLETLQASGKLGRIITAKDIDEAGWQAVRALDAAQFPNSGTAQAPHDERKAAYQKAADAKWQEATKILDEAQGVTDPNLEELPVEIIPEGAENITPQSQAALNKVFSTSDQDTITFDEAQSIQQLPSETFGTPQREAKARTAATVAIIRNSQDMTVEAAVRQVLVDAEKAGDKFDPSNDKHLEWLQSVLEKGFNETPYKPKLAKGVSRAHDPTRGMTLGEFLGGNFDPRNVEHLISPEQLGDMDKLREMLGASEQ